MRLYLPEVVQDWFAVLALLGVAQVYLPEFLSKGLLGIRT
jgi:hypothetical protein